MEGAQDLGSFEVQPALADEDFKIAIETKKQFHEGGFVPEKKTVKKRMFARRGEKGKGDVVDMDDDSRSKLGHDLQVRITSFIAAVGGFTCALR